MKKTLTITTLAVAAFASEANAAPAFRGAHAARSEVMRLVNEGLQDLEIAARLGVSAKMIETHRARAMGKLGIRSDHLRVRQDDDGNVVNENAGILLKVNNLA